MILPGVHSDLLAIKRIYPSIKIHKKGKGLSILQFIVATVIKSLKEYQHNYDVFLWDMAIRGSMVHIAFHPVFGYMIGDNEGHDKTCGKYLNRQKVVRLC
jgi:hypothetical protein